MILLDFIFKDLMFVYVSSISQNWLWVSNKTDLFAKKEDEEVSGYVYGLIFLLLFCLEQSETILVYMAFKNDYQSKHASSICMETQEVIAQALRFRGVEGLRRVALKGVQAWVIGPTGSHRDSNDLWDAQRVYNWGMWLCFISTHPHSLHKQRNCEKRFKFVSTAPLRSADVFKSVLRHWRSRSLTILVQCSLISSVMGRRTAGNRLQHAAEYLLCLKPYIPY